MKVLTRDFSMRERTLLLIFGVIIVGLVYFLAVDQPVRGGIKAAQTEIEALEVQVEGVEARLDEIDAMKKEMEELESSGENLSRMPSYNGGKDEVEFLHNTLGSTIDYYVGFTQITREGNVIRREFSLQYKCSDFNSAVEVMRTLESSDIRCLISDMSVTPLDNTQSGNVLSGGVQVSCTATFYETMYDGVEDKELPEDSAAAAEETQTDEE